MLLVFISISLAGVISLSVLETMTSKRVIENKAIEESNLKIKYIIERIEKEFLGHKKIAESIGKIYESNGNNLKKEEYRKILEELVFLNENTLGTGIWLEPYVYSDKDKYFGPYVYKTSDGLKYTEVYESDKYDYPSTEWYKIGKNSSKKEAWTRPYYDETSGITMITTSIAIYDENDKFIGVISADYDLNTIEEIVEEINLDNKGFAFLLDKKGGFITHSDIKSVRQNNINSLGGYSKISHDIISDKRGNATLELNNKKYKVFYHKLPSTNWTLVVSVLESEIYEPVYLLMKNKVIISLIILILTVISIGVFSIKLSKPILKEEEQLRDFIRKSELKKYNRLK